jgi:hypothetical protein
MSPPRLAGSVREPNNSIASAAATAAGAALIDLWPKLAFVSAQQHGKGSTEKLPKADELLQLPGRGPFDFGPLMRALAEMNFAGPIEIFMHPVPRGVPILGSVAEVTAEVNRARSHLRAALGGDSPAD